ncbi:hypothetical protein MNB_SUP05-SYMBIONT-7-407 [hydrothermal vent metagenome]|uniref:Uncharacterized protein n=1 Tax=hydrothermal vent metagenome TaxID=652676 RepID=A0A1W1E3A8_9ZZZZ
MSAKIKYSVKGEGTGLTSVGVISEMLGTGVADAKLCLL